VETRCTCAEPVGVLPLGAFQEARWAGAGGRAGSLACREVAQGKGRCGSEGKRVEDRKGGVGEEQAGARRIGRTEATVERGGRTRRKRR